MSQVVICHFYRLPDFRRAGLIKYEPFGEETPERQKEGEEEEEEKNARKLAFDTVTDNE